jgi:glycosyltransferase involved in cell wall biosynthesis
MDFSIIIATYDRAESLDRLLRSVAEHFVKSSIAFEVIVATMRGTKLQRDALTL